MRHFLKLVEIMKRQGLIGLGREPHEPEVEHVRYWPREDQWEIIEKCQPIVFQRTGDAPLDLDDNSRETGPREFDLDAPFPIFSVEMLEGPVCQPRPEDLRKMSVWCIVTHEVEPRKFLFLSLVQMHAQINQNERDRLVVLRDDEWIVFAGNSEGGVVTELVKRLNTQQVGTENVRQRLEVGTGKHKRVTRIRRIVHVRPKKPAALAEPGSSGRAVDWSHRWMVRGHWVRLAGRLGKDREGRYCVEGFTWRKEHEKGPEHAPLVSKVRVVNEGVPLEAV